MNRLNDFDPHPARKFSWRQLELMDHGYPRGIAQAIVEERSNAFLCSPFVEYSDSAAKQSL